jgi:hypothetical protein
MIVRKISEYFTNVGDMDTTTGSDIKIGDGSKKTFKTVTGMWCEDSSRHLKIEEEQDDEESWGFEGGYSSERGRSRHSLDWQVVSSGKICQLRVKEMMKEKGMTLMGRIKVVHHCLR